jgi:hypothetical protein
MLGIGVTTSMMEASPRLEAATDFAEPSGWDETRPDTEKRAQARFTVLIRTAKIVSPSGEYLCVIRDVSQEGLKVRVFHPLPKAEPLAIELATGEREPIETVWQNGDLAGFRFIEPVALPRLLADAPAGRKKRSVRLHFATPMLVIARGQRIAAEFRDISQHGASLDCGAHLAMGERIRLECDGLPPLDARVRWRRTPYYGVIFEQTFRFDELARLIEPFADAAANRD